MSLYLLLRLKVCGEDKPPRSDGRVCKGLWNPLKDRVGVWKPQSCGLQGLSCTVSISSQDVTVGITNQHTLHTTLSVISQYEQASGAHLNRDKSVLISWGKWDATIGVSTSASPQAYLEWLMNSQRKLQIPLSILSGCVQSLIRWHGLGLSLLARVTLLKSYIQPRFLYHFTLASTPETQLETYIKVEAWFLATSRAKYNSSAPAIPLISKSWAIQQHALAFCPVD